MAKAKIALAEAVTEEPIGALPVIGEQTEDFSEIPENLMPTHAGMHAMHEAEEHHPGDVHMEDESGPFIPQGNLDAPECRDGMVQRWVRMSMFGRPDAQNRSVMERLGWKPRRLETVPAGLRTQYPAFRHTAFGDVIMQGDLVLCERPKPLADRESQYYRDKSERQVQLTDMLAIGPGTAGGFHQVQVVERRKKVVMRRPIQAADGG